MTIEKNLHRLWPKPYPKGYDAPNASSHYTQSGILKTALKKVQTSPIETISDNDLPFSLRLRAVLKPHRKDRGGQKILATIMDGKNPHQPFSIYEDPSMVDFTYDAIDVVYDDFMEAQKSPGDLFAPVKEYTPWTVQINKGDLLHRLTFQTLDRSLQVPLDLEGGNQDKVWPAGGFYQPGCSLSHIQQSFFTVSSATAYDGKGQTVCTPFLAKDLSNPKKYNYPNLKLALESKKSYIQVFFGSGDQEGNYFYFACAVLEKGPMIEIIYQRKYHDA